MKTVIYNIGTLAGILPEGVMKLEGKDMGSVECIDNAYLVIEDGIITEYGSCGAEVSLKNNPSHSFVVGPSPCGQGGSTVFQTNLRSAQYQNLKECDADEHIDAKGGFVMPAFCDSHTHIVYAGCRDGEFRDKIAGLSYEEIAARGGGILNSADLLHETSEDELYEQSMARVREIMSMGTGAVEIKSGYGLTVEDELKMLRVIRRIKETTPLTVKANFLGAHAVGRAYRGRQSEYVDLVCNEMLPKVAEEGLADFVDVFCDEGFFTVEETARILEKAAEYGIRPKIHANELAVSGGVQVGVRYDALSVDHLEKTTDAEIETLRGSGTMPTMLPGCSFFLGIPYGNAKGYIEAGLPVALASDYNPGSSPSGNMRFVMALGCIRMRLTPEQSFNACTINTAYAMGVSDTLGSITIGKKANLIITKPVPSLAFIPYSHQTPVIEKVILEGKIM
jgi:imidazolonepropionase